MRYLTRQLPKTPEGGKNDAVWTIWSLTEANSMDEAAVFCVRDTPDFDWCYVQVKHESNESSPVLFRIEKEALEWRRLLNQ